jgi:peptidoglycan/xylan/chitin deacetylase (PgdA/CDA1 family)
MYIFGFHLVEPTPQNPYLKTISITPEGLRQVIRTLKWLGLEPVSLKEALTLKDEALNSTKKFVMTFDDGYENFYTHAAPVLQAENCPATVMILANKIGTINDWDPYKSEPPRLMSMDQIKELGQNPLFTFGSHGLNHLNVAELTPDEMRPEILDSYNILSTALQKAFIPVFAYPWGKSSDITHQLILASPYAAALSIRKGAWNTDTPSFTLPRYSVYQHDAHPAIFLAKLLKNRIIFPFQIQVAFSKSIQKRGHSTFIPIA